MTGDRPAFDPEHPAGAERLDAEVAAVLAGASAPDVDPIALWLATAMRPQVPPGLRSEIAAAIGSRARRAWRWVRVCAAALALLLLIQGLTGILSGEWLAERLGEPFSPHAFGEGGLALLAAAIAVAAGALYPAWVPVSVVVGAPLGLALGAGGIAELDEFAAGAALHMTEGALALCLIAAWSRARRYAKLPSREGGA